MGKELIILALLALTACTTTKGSFCEIAKPMRPSAAAIDAMTLLRRLQDGTPSVRADPSRAHEGKLVFNPLCLDEPGVAAIVAAMRALL